MNVHRILMNRRRDSRYCFRMGQPIAWKLDDIGTRRRKGWLNDQSSSGVSFLVESPRVPHVGDDIQFRDQLHTQATLCHVVRIMALDGNLSLVGCRKDTSAPSPTDRKPKPPHAVIHTRVRLPRGTRRMATAH